MVAGVVIGNLMPAAIAGLRSIEFGKGSQINAPIAVLIWLMTTPMMMKVDFSSVRNVGKRPAGLPVTLFINWVVTVCHNAKESCPVFMGAVKRLHHSFDDPPPPTVGTDEERMAIFRRVRDELRAYLRGFAASESET